MILLLLHALGGVLASLHSDHPQEGLLRITGDQLGDEKQNGWPLNLLFSHCVTTVSTATKLVPQRKEYSLLNADCKEKSVRKEEWLKKERENNALTLCHVNNTVFAVFHIWKDQRQIAKISPLTSLSALNKSYCFLSSPQCLPVFPPDHIFLISWRQHLYLGKVY